MKRIVKVFLNDSDYEKAEIFARNRSLDMGQGNGVPSVIRMALKAYLNKYAGEFKNGPLEALKREKAGNV